MDTINPCDFGCGREATFRWEGKRLCWECKRPLLMASTHLALRRIANDKSLAANLSVMAGARVTIEIDVPPEDVS